MGAGLSIVSDGDERVSQAGAAIEDTDSLTIHCTGPGERPACRTPSNSLFSLSCLLCFWRIGLLLLSSETGNAYSMPAIPCLASNEKTHPYSYKIFADKVLEVGISRVDSNHLRKADPLHLYLIRSILFEMVECPAVNV
jgi:hypothetical protein